VIKQGRGASLDQWIRSELELAHQSYEDLVVVEIDTARIGIALAVRVST
jgi:hypothetical protein